MTAQAAPPLRDLVLLGGDSRAAAAVAARNPEARCRWIARRDGPGVRVRIDDYLTVPSDLALEGSTIVNCVGTDAAPPDVLDRLNRQVPSVWARAAGDRGARAFIHLSSFSVYRRQDLVRIDSEPAPVTPYGQSKLAAEEELTAFANEGLAVSILRVPILVSPAGTAGRQDKLARLLGLLRRVHCQPMPRPSIERAMLGYDGLAAAVNALIERPRPMACAADPEPFSYELVADLAREQGVRLLRLPAPKVLTAALARLSPGLHERLLTSMNLAAEDNLLTGRGDYLRLRSIIASHMAG